MVTKGEEVKGGSDLIKTSSSEEFLQKHKKATSMTQSLIGSLSEFLSEVGQSGLNNKVGGIGEENPILQEIIQET